MLPIELAHNLSDINPLVLVKAISAGVHVVDPLTGEVGNNVVQTMTLCFDLMKL